MVETCEAEVADLDLARGGNEDVGGFEITVDDPVVVEVGDAVDELPQK